jgi:hypothetical protein
MLLLPLIGGNAPLDRPLHVPGTDELYQYDDGSAYWLSWDGLYRGVWFHVSDFVPGAPGGCLYQMEYWFYHHSSYPWDTASFYAELYNGDAGSPVTQLDQTSLTAGHFAPCYVDYAGGITVGPDFWGLINTEMSAGGWPSLLGDNTPNPTGNDHSFYSDDFIVWIPWVPEDSGGIGLEQETWGSVKVLYGSRPLTTPGCCDFLIRIVMLWGSHSSLY